MYVFLALIYALVKAVKVILVFGEIVLKAYFHHIFTSYFQRIYAKGLCYILHVAFHGEGYLRYAVGSHGSCCRPVGIYRIGVSLVCVTFINLAESRYSLGRYTVSVGSIGSLIGEGLTLSGNKCTVFSGVCNEMHPYGMAHSVAGKGLLPCHIYLYGTSAHLGRKICAKGLIKGVLFVSESAADVGLYYPYLSPGYA